jgi:mannose-6-phosphate isomerase-like protein (cupin superfamily)
MVEWRDGVDPVPSSLWGGESGDVPARTAREVTAGPDGSGRMKRILLAVVALFSAVEASALPAGSTTLTPSNRRWEPYGSADRVAVRGDLADADCPSVTLLRLHPDTRLPPHSAPVDRTYFVLSGTVHVGIGKKWDDAKLRTLPAGSFWLVPANTSTFEWNEDEVVCQVTVPRPAKDCPHPEEPAFFTPDKIRWSAIGSVERAVLAGDQGKPGCPSSLRYRFPPGVHSPVLVESPSTGVAVGTVLSGALIQRPDHAGDAAVARELVAGTVFVIPEGRGQALSTAVETIVQREFPGSGPGICKWREPRP